MADTLFTTSSVFPPRAKITAGGLTLGGVVSASVTSNSYLAADKWSAVVALGPDPERDAAWWGSQDEIECEVFFSLDDGKSWKSLIIGTADRIRVDEATGLVQLDGQDFTAKLIRDYIIDDFPNLSAAAIARKFAADAGLQADVQDTPGLVGTILTTEHTGISTGQFSRQVSKWDYLCELAQKYEGYSVWVKGRTLHFKVPPEPDKSTPYVIKYTRGQVQQFSNNALRKGHTFNAKTLICERDLTRSKDIEVIVRSWHGSRASQFQVSARRGRGQVTHPHTPRHGHTPDAEDPLEGIPRAAGEVDVLAGIPGYKAAGSHTPRPHNDAAPPTERGLHRYIIERANLSPEQALQLAQAKLKEATLHEREITVTLPGELTMDPQTVIRLTGHGTSWDQDYYVKEIERRLSTKGFEETLIARNESPGGTTTITESST